MGHFDRLGFPCNGTTSLELGNQISRPIRASTDHVPPPCTRKCVTTMIQNNGYSKPRFSHANPNCQWYVIVAMMRNPIIGTATRRVKNPTARQRPQTNSTKPTT